MQNYYLVRNSRIAFGKAPFFLPFTSDRINHASFSFRHYSMKIDYKNVEKMLTALKKNIIFGKQFHRYDNNNKNVSTVTVFYVIIIVSLKFVVESVFTKNNLKNDKWD